MNLDEYTCAVCGQSFTKAVSDEEAKSECKVEFGVTPDQVACDIVCDDCYQQFMRWHTETNRKN